MFNFQRILKLLFLKKCPCIYFNWKAIRFVIAKFFFYYHVCCFSSISDLVQEAWIVVSHSFGVFRVGQIKMHLWDKQTWILDQVNIQKYCCTKQQINKLTINYLIALSFIKRFKRFYGGRTLTNSSVNIGPF